MDKKRIFISTVLISSVSLSLLSCSSKDSNPGDSKRDLDSSVRDEIHENAQNNDLLTGELENKEIKWLSDWDINPDGTGKNVPTELAVFQERYGGSMPTFGTSYWFYPQIFRYLDERGFPRSYIFKALTTDVTSRDLLKKKLLELYPSRQSLINQVFERYAE